MDDSIVEKWQHKAIEEGLLNAIDPKLLFEPLETIGHGATADIMKAIDRERGEIVAIKRFKSRYKTEDDWKDIIKEISFLRECNSPYLIKFHESYLHGRQVWIVMDYCLGSCFDIMELFKVPFAEKEIQAVSLGILQGLNYLHNNQKIHRDIKARNILLSVSAEVKLCDFGASADVATRDGRANTFIGSPYWLAPEVIMAMDTGTYSFPADIWSFGITLIELAELQPPLFNLQTMSALFRIPNNPSPTLTTDGWSQSFHQFLSLCLAKQEDDRSTASQLLQHTFVADISIAAQGILRDLIERSEAVVRGELDISRLTSSGLISNIPESPSQSSTVSNISSTSKLPAVSSECIAEEPPELPELNTPSIEKLVSRTDNAADENSDTGKEVEPRKQAKAIRDAKFNTLKLPSALRREHQQLNESSRLDVQMKGRRKLQKKQEEATRGLGKQQQAELLHVSKKFSEKMADFQRQCDAAMQALLKDHSISVDRLEKAQALERKRYEEDLVRYTDKRKREAKSHLQSKLLDLKKDHRRQMKEDGTDKRELKKMAKEQLLQMQEQRKVEWKATAAAYIDGKMTILRTQQEKALARLKLEHMEEEFRLKEEHLSERFDLIVAHETEKVHVLLRAHRQQLHQIELEYLNQREKLEIAHLQENHAQAHVSTRRKHTIQARAHDKQLKKLSLRDEQVQRQFRRQTSQLSGTGHLDNLNDSRDKTRPTSAERKYTKRLEKLEKQALNDARQSVVAQATIKLNETQIKEINDLRRHQEEELHELKEFFQQRREHLLELHTKQLQELEHQISDQGKAAVKLRETEMSNFRQGRDNKLHHERNKFEAKIKELDEIVATQRQRVGELDKSWLEE